MREAARQGAEPCVFPETLLSGYPVRLALTGASRWNADQQYAAYAAWGQDKALPGNESFSVPYQDLARDRFLLGSPDDVVQEMLRYQDELGVNYLIFRMQWPGMPQEQALRQIELMGKEVIPRVKAAN